METTFDFQIAFILNLVTYNVLTLLCLAYSTWQLKKHNKDFGLFMVLALVAWLVSICSFFGIEDPEVNPSTTAHAFIKISGIATNAFILLPALFEQIVSIPKNIKNRKEARKQRKQIEIKSKTTNIFDL